MSSRMEDPVEQSTFGEMGPLLVESGLASEIGFVLRMAQLAVFEDLLNRLAVTKLTLTQFTILRLIKARPGLMQQHVSDALGVKKTNLVAVIDKLEEMGVVRRVGSTSDRRAYALHLTKKGERTYESAMKAVKAHNNLMTRLFGQEEVENFVKSARNVAVGLAAERRKRGSDI